MIYVLTGANSHQIQARLRELRESFIAKHGEEGLESYTGEDVSLDTLQNITSGLSLFTTHRLVVVRYLSENKPVAEQFVEEIKNIPEETVIILVEGVLDKRTAYYKALKKLEHFEEYSEPDERALRQWIKQVVEDEQATITPEAQQALLVAVGADQSRLAHELAKLTIYSKKITIDTVTALVEPNSQESVFALLDAALSGNQARAQELLLNLEHAHEDPYQIANMLIWQVHIVAVVASAGGMAESEIAKKAKLNPYVVKKTAALTKNISSQKLQQIIDTVAQLDITLKTKSVQPWAILSQTLYTM